MTVDDGEHLDGIRVAAFLDARLDPEERRKVEAHLESCDRCRSEVIAVGRLLESESPPERRVARSRLIAIGVVAAAAALMVAIFQPFVGSGGDRAGAGAFRSRAEGVATFEALSPVQGSWVHGGEPFAWRPAGASAVYRFRVIDEAGRVIASLSTTDTIAALPGDVELQPGTTYFWYVDALLDDGSSATTGHQPFHVQR